MGDIKQLIEGMWCNCGLDNPEPKYHSTDCTYRVEWEQETGSVHMSATQLKIAEEITGWKSYTSMQCNKYDPDFLDRIFMQRTEEAYHYGWRKR